MRIPLRRYCTLVCMLFSCAAANSALAQDEPPEYDDIVVQGITYPSPRIYLDMGLPGVFVENGLPIFPGEDGAPVRSPHACIERNAKREIGTDKLSENFQAEVATKADAGSREYATVMIMNATDANAPTFRYAPLTPGQTWAEAWANGQPGPTVSVNIPPLGQFDYIVGIIHSHPLQDDPNPALDRLPSGQDWGAYSAMQNLPSHPRLAPETAFSQYILGPDGTVRQYRQDAGQPTQPTNGTRNGC